MTASNARSKPIRVLVLIARLLLGLVFFVFGLNGFLNFIPQPKTPPPDFIIALKNTHYMIQLISGTELLTGVLLLCNLFVPFALVLIAPVIVNIICFHIFLTPASIPPGIVVLILEICLVIAYRRSFAPLFARSRR